MKSVLAAGLAVAFVGAVAKAGDMGDSWDRYEIERVQNSGDPGPFEPGYQPRVYLVRSAAGCSNAGDQAARPVYTRTARGFRFLGYECIQDNRGGHGG